MGVSSTNVKEISEDGLEIKIDGTGTEVSSTAFEDNLSPMTSATVDEESGGSHQEERPGSTVMATHQSKRISIADNPFAERKGKSLVWTNVNMTLAPNNSSDQPKKLLSNVWGEVPPKKITAITGPSGAGKSSLLNILSGRAKSRGRITVSADIRLDDYEVNPTKMKVRKQIAFVAQDDSLQITATPRECIRFSAKLRLPRSTTDDELDRIVGRMIEELGLSKCADTIVGAPLLKGISGGERKRTSVGVELVVKPAVVLLDEPTSGLDSFSAVQLLHVLKKVANAGSSVLFTIHQPSSEVFDAFDNFILLSKGRVLYQGPVTDVPDYFAARGYPVPPRYNPADFVMNVAQSYQESDLEKKGFFPEDTRKLPPALHRSSTVLLNRRDSVPATVDGKSTTNDNGVHSGQHQPILTQIRMMLVRELIGMKRNKHPLVARCGFACFLGLLIGMIFFGVGTTDPSIPKNFQSHFGALTMVLMTNMFGTAMPSLLQFPTERPVFLREYSTDHYSVVAYFASRLTMEAFVTFLQVLLSSSITFNMIGLQMNFVLFVGIAFSLAMASTATAVMLGSIVENPKTAVELLPLLFVPQLLFAGFFVATDLIPVFIRWAQYLCSLTYAVRLSLLYEFGDCDAPTCQNLLQANDVYPEKALWYWMMLLALFSFFRLAALGFLRKKATKFL